MNTSTCATHESRHKICFTCTDPFTECHLDSRAPFHLFSSRLPNVYHSWGMRLCYSMHIYWETCQKSISWMSKKRAWKYPLTLGGDFPVKRIQVEIFPQSLAVLLLPHCQNHPSSIFIQLVRQRYVRLQGLHLSHYPNLHLLVFSLCPHPGKAPHRHLCAGVKETSTWPSSLSFVPRPSASSVDSVCSSFGFVNVC